jgi:hypothetical protein
VHVGSITITHRPDDEGSKHLWNVCNLLTTYTAQHPRRQSSSSMNTYIYSGCCLLWGILCACCDGRSRWAPPRAGHGPSPSCSRSPFPPRRLTKRSLSRRMPSYVLMHIFWSFCLSEVRQCRYNTNQ